MSFSRRRFLKLGLAAVASAMGTGGFVYAHKFEPAWVELVEQELTLPRLDPAFDGYRVIQLSDIHMGTGMTEAQLGEVVEMVNAREPDLVAITGDFITYGNFASLGPALTNPLSRLQARDGVVGVLGNHDHWHDHQAVRDIMSESGIEDLSNTVRTLRRGDSVFHVAGVDDIWYHHDRLDLVLDQLPDEGAAMLLAHEPDFADSSAASGRFDLQISGHSHGGQINIPFFGPLWLPPHGEKYWMGRYQVGEMIQYTSRGVGTAGLPLRFNCRPEVTEFVLRSAT